MYLLNSFLFRCSYHHQAPDTTLGTISRLTPRYKRAIPISPRRGSGPRERQRVLPTGPPPEGTTLVSAPRGGQKKNRRRILCHHTWLLFPSFVLLPFVVFIFCYWKSPLFVLAVCLYVNLCASLFVCFFMSLFF